MLDALEAMPNGGTLRIAGAQIDGSVPGLWSTRAAFLGAGGRAVDATLACNLGLPVDHGLLIQEIHPDSPAAKAGLRSVRRRPRSDQLQQTTSDG